MDIWEIFYINLAVTGIMGVLLLVLPFIFRYQRNKFLERERDLRVESFQ